MNDTDFNYLMLYLENHYGLNNENRIHKALTVAAHQNQYHPIRDYLNALQWDGTDRIPTRCTIFSARRSADYTREVMQLFLLEPSTACSNQAASLKPCCAWWVVREQVSPPSSGCWHAKMNGFPTT